MWANNFWQMVPENYNGEKETSSINDAGKISKPHAKE